MCCVLDALSHDLVLGMQFLAKHNPSVDFAAREMTFADGVAISTEPGDSVVSSAVQLCSV